MCMPVVSPRETLVVPVEWRLLIVDDRADGLGLQGQLVRLGFDETRILLVEFGHAACEALQRARFDMVFVEWCLPGTSGVETTRRLRMVAPDVPIIGVSADADLDGRRLFRAAGADDFVLKPIGGELLAALAVRWGARAAEWRRAP